MDYIERRSPARGQINFTKQEVNANLSKDVSYATIDLKDASDRVSVELVSMLFADTVLHDRLLALRSDRVELPNGRYHSPSCYATMGNALCFPIESIVFYALCTASLRRAGFRHDRPHVYGDDIIVPVEAVETVVGDLQSVGLVVNTTKTCYKTPFRESCGAEWFASRDVTITRPKVSDCDTPISWCRLLTSAKRMLDAGWFHAASAICDILDEMEPVPYGTGPLQIHLDKPSRCKTRFNRGLQCLEYRTMVLSCVPPAGAPSDEARLYAWFTGRASKTAATEDTTSRADRDVRPKRIWQLVTSGTAETRLQRRILQIAVDQTL